MNSDGTGVTNISNTPGLDTNPDWQSLPMIVIGGTMIPLDSTALLLAGAQMNAAWMIPVIVLAIGIGIVIARKL